MSNDDLFTGISSMQDLGETIFQLSNAYFHEGILSNYCGHNSGNLEIWKSGNLEFWWGELQVNSG